MSNPLKNEFLSELEKRFGIPQKLENSNSLYEINNGTARVYYRYSKKHPNNKTFFGLRKIDLQVLEGTQGIICFFWEGQKEPLFIPYDEYEEIFASLKPATDGQYKVQIFDQEKGAELYIPNAGRFNVESYFGWHYLESLITMPQTLSPPLSHTQVQTLLGRIGSTKGYDVWIPSSDRTKLDWSITSTFKLANSLPPALDQIRDIAEEIDVIWLNRGNNKPVALYEVEHSTPIYSGLLRFNDVHLMLPNIGLKFGIVSNEIRRSLFVRQTSRPTFRSSGLSDICTFLEYRNVYGWHKKLQK